MPILFRWLLPVLMLLLLNPPGALPADTPEVKEFLALCQQTMTETGSYPATATIICRQLLDKRTDADYFLYKEAAIRYCSLEPQALAAAERANSGNTKFLNRQAATFRKCTERHLAQYRITSPFDRQKTTAGPGVAVQQKQGGRPPSLKDWR